MFNFYLVFNLYNNSCTNKMYIGHMNSQRLIRACTLANYTLDLDLVTPRACARGKVIGRVVVVVSTKIAIFQDTGI